MTHVRLRRWTDVDFPILAQSNAPEMTRFLGGPESDAAVARRHERYLRGWDVGLPRMFAIVDDAGVALGSIGWWEATWRDHAVYETGWTVFEHAQRRGVATAALALVVSDVREHGERRLLMACPAVDNVASNALCRAGGFTVAETREDTIRGATLTLNFWTLDPGA